MGKLNDYFAKIAFSSVRSEFYEDISEAIQAQESIVGFLRQEAKRETTSGSKLRAGLYAKWIRRLGDSRFGGRISRVMKPDIPASDAMIISAFEEAGKPREGFDIARESAERSAQIKKIYKSAAIYPSISIIAIIAVSSFLVTAFPKVGDPAKWPDISRIAYEYMQFLASNAMVIIGGLVLFGILLSSEYSPLSFSRFSGRLRERLDKTLPPWTMYRQLQSATMLLLLSALIQSGLSTSAALHTIANGSGKWMQYYLSRIIRKIGDQTNEQIVYAFKNSLFDERMYFRLESSSLRGGFDNALIRLATTSFGKIIDTAKKQAFALQQIFIAFAGGSILLMVSGIINMGFYLSKL